MFWLGRSLYICHRRLWYKAYTSQGVLDLCVYFFPADLSPPKEVGQLVFATQNGLLIWAMSGPGPGNYPVSACSLPNNLSNTNPLGMPFTPHHPHTDTKNYYFFRHIQSEG